MATALHLRRGLPSLLPRLARKLPPPKLGLCDGDEEYETYEALARTPLVPLGHVRKANQTPKLLIKCE